ncbi:MAG: hypothetical protein JKY51_11655 [Opitutaceae bacterium]|nr:hypothetical protein [Opitutaceae bacterium]
MLRYQDVIEDKVQVGNKVVVIGTGGIAFDLITKITRANTEDWSLEEKQQDFASHWGIDYNNQLNGGLMAPVDNLENTKQITMLQRRVRKPGAGLGKTTVWIHRAQFKRRNVKTMSKVNYVSVSDEGLHVDIRGKQKVLAVDSIVVCAGQQSHVAFDLSRFKQPVHLIGGANNVVGLDAKSAIETAAWLAAKI